MVFQSYALYPHMTVFDNIAFSMKLAGKSKAERTKRVDEIAKTLQLTLCSTANPPTCPADSVRGSPWGARWCASRPPF